MQALLDGVTVPSLIRDCAAAGVKAADFLKDIGGLETNRSNQLVVRPTLQTTRDDDIFVIGDCAAVNDASGRQLPGVAPVAKQQGVYAARVIKAAFEGNPLTEAARLVMGGGQPDDPDYRTLWPEIEVADVGATETIRRALETLASQHGPVEIEWTAQGDTVTFLQLRPYAPPPPAPPRQHHPASTAPPRRPPAPTLRWSTRRTTAAGWAGSSWSTRACT